MLFSIDKIDDPRDLRSKEAVLSSGWIDLFYWAMKVQKRVD